MSCTSVNRPNKR